MLLNMFWAVDVMMLVLFHSIAVHNSEPNSKFPILSEYMQMKTLEENGGEGELLGFNAVATKLLGVVTAPIQNALSSRQAQVNYATAAIALLSMAIFQKNTHCNILLPCFCS